MNTNLTLRVIPTYRTSHDFYIRTMHLTNIPDRLKLGLRLLLFEYPLAIKNTIPTILDLETHTYEASYDLHVEDKYLSELEVYLINSGWRKR
jgi:hypothetical protein